MESILVRQLVAPAAAASAVLSLACAPLARAQVSSVSPFTAVQLTDVMPTDWAYQALQNLVEQHGCVAGYPSGRFQGQQSISRYEAAALLNACLDRITAMTDEVKGLIHAFRRDGGHPGRVDGLEARMETGSSSSPPPNQWLAISVGANHFSGSDDELVDQNNQVSAPPRSTTSSVDPGDQFQRQDLLTPCGPATSVVKHPLAVGAQQPGHAWECLPGDGGPNHVFIDKLFYSFPIGDRITVTVGPNLGQDDMLPIWPTFYDSPPILDALTLNGALAAYNKNQGPGVGMTWAPESGFRFAANYVAANGALSDGSGGLATDYAGGTGTVQLGWEADGWAIAGIYSMIQNGNDLIAYATPFTQAQLGQAGDTHAFGLSGAWHPANAGWIPSISVGWGINNSDSQLKGQVTTSQSWSVGLLS